jgi:EAL domain-containing protein (putative c-di-GMP-specific phosphodiesterase class I)
MVDKFKSMGIETVFEGLEERWQLDLADKCGVDMVQGFILARPKLVDDDEPTIAQASDGEAEPELAPALDAPARPMPRYGRPFGRRLSAQ